MAYVPERNIYFFVPLFSGTFFLLPRRLSRQFENNREIHRKKYGKGRSKKSLIHNRNACVVGYNNDRIDCHFIHGKELRA
jgi:hypothetical protein